MSKEAAEAELAEGGAVIADRDNRIRRAHSAGVTKHRIHVITGVARTTIDRILQEENPTLATADRPALLTVAGALLEDARHLFYQNHRYAAENPDRFVRFLPDSIEQAIRDARPRNGGYVVHGTPDGRNTMGHFRWFGPTAAEWQEIQAKALEMLEREKRTIKQRIKDLNAQINRDAP